MDQRTGTTARRHNAGEPSSPLMGWNRLLCLVLVLIQT